MTDQKEQDHLEQRRIALEKALATHDAASKKAAKSAASGSTSGAAQAFKLSSEFLAGIIVGIGLGWFFDYFAGTSPWGLIVFLLLGFGAGILNVLRSVGVVAEAGLRSPQKGDDNPDGK